MPPPVAGAAVETAEETSRPAVAKLPQLPKKIVITPHRRALSSADAAFCFHAVAFLIYAKVWGWHVTPQAAMHPGATGFGWFFRYLTFYSFSLQALTLALSALADVTQADNKWKALLDGWSDDLSCALFALANVVTIMYYIVDTSTKGDVEGKGVVRPPYLGFAVHVFNSMVAWSDLAVGHPRTFSRRSSRICLGIASFYLVWIVVCSHFNGVFPYPFLNKMPWPQGFLAVAAASNILFFLLFKTGKRLSAPLLRWRASKAKTE